MNGPLDLAYHKDSGRSDTHVYQETLGKLVIHVCSKQLPVFNGWRKGGGRNREKEIRPEGYAARKETEGDRETGEGVEERNGEDSCRLVIRASIVRRRNYDGS